MRTLTTLSTLLLLGLMTQVNASTFSANKMIDQCLSDDLSMQKQASCQGFFYGLLSKKEALLMPQKDNSLVDRAYTTRTSTSNYDIVKARKYGLDTVCMLDNISYQDFKSVIIANAPKYSQTTNVAVVTDILARKYSC
ncbi:hypothetical protein ACFSJY_08755 [Thalassotalea euphylliae]|uniref:hypothetical protein n=1 Tax=Thalassotalea euphylliae TaxID=1655234 RepID=UPI0036271FA6